MRITSSVRYRLSRSTGFGILLFIVLIIPAASHAASSPDITIFFSSDTRGMMRRCGCTEGQLGGLSARASYIKSHRNGNTLVLDAGDSLFDGLNDFKDRKDFYDLKASTLMSAMKQPGYDAILPGEYDFEFGLDFFKKKASEANSKVICANIETHEGPAFDGSMVREIGGLKVGITGVMDDKFPYDSFPSIFRGVKIKNPLRTASEQVRALRKKADLVICLAHLSVSDQEKFLKESGADVVIFGHGGEGQDQPERFNNTLAVKGFYKGKKIGRLDLWLGSKDGKKFIKDYKYETIALGENIPPDPEVEKLIAGYKRELKEKKFVFNDRAGSGLYAGADKCRGCHEKSFVNWSATGHARAFSSLEKTGDQYDPECLPCHVTGYGSSNGYMDGNSALRNVSCEDCHEAAGSHYKAMTPISRGVSEKICTGCHDDYNSPNFDFEKYKQLGGAHRGKNGP